MFKTSIKELQSGELEIGPLGDVENLINRAVIGLDEDEQSLSDRPTGWQAIVCLHRLASRDVLDASLAACTDVDPLKRRVGAAVLGQLGHDKVGFEPVFTEIRYNGLVDLFNDERAGGADARVLSDVCVALGHLHDPRAIRALLELREHPDAGVRFGVVFGLIGHQTPEAIDGLVVLSSDSDDDVRNWATFGIGQLTETDTPSIRAALQARLNDPCIDAGNEAIEGLARRDA